MYNGINDVEYAAVVKDCRDAFEQLFEGLGIMVHSLLLIPEGVVCPIGRISAVGGRIPAATPGYG